MKSTPASRYWRPIFWMISGLVRVRRSLLPFSSDGWLPNRLPRKSSSPSLKPWIITPQEPSSSSRRFLASCFIHSMRASRVLMSIQFLGTNAENAAGRISQVGLVESIEVKLAEAAGAQLLHLVGQHGGGDDTACFHVLVQPFIGFCQPGRNGGARLGRHAGDAIEIGGGHHAGHDGNGDAGTGRIVAKTRRQVIVETELAQRAGSAGVHLGLQQFDVMAMTGRIRMSLGIKGNADFERRNLLDSGNQFRRGSVASGMWLVRRFHARHVAAQRRDMTDAGVPIAAHDIVELPARRRYAGQMRGRLQAGLLDDALDGGMGAPTRRTTGAIGDRDKGRR